MRTKLETCALNWNKFYQFEKSVRTKFEACSVYFGKFIDRVRIKLEFKIILKMRTELESCALNWNKFCNFMKLLRTK